MMHLLVLVVILIGARQSLSASLNVQVSLVREYSSTRPRRDTKDSNLPDELDFQLSGPGLEVIDLRLKRSPLVPTTTSDGWTSSGQVIEDAGVYTDSESRSAIIVKRGIKDDYNLTGMVHQGNESFQLEPSPSGDGNNNSVNHTLTPIAGDDQVVDFGNDTFKYGKRGDIAQIIDIYGSNGGDKKAYKDNKKTELEETSHKKHDSIWEEHKRQRRSATQHTIELAMIADYSDYSKFKDYYGEPAAIQTMILWYTYVAEGIRIRYESIEDSSLQITTKVTHLRILTSAESDSIVRDLVQSNDEFDSEDGLLSLSRYVENETPNSIPISDHYMLFTQYSPESASGVAFVERACTFLGVSITKDDLQATTALVAAHEIGHSVGAYHDGRYVSCTDLLYFIMAAAYRVPVLIQGNPWKFSPCSIYSIEQYLREVTCTSPEHTSNDPEGLPSSSAGFRAGQVLDRDRQCRFHFGNDNSLFCENTQIVSAGLESICSKMYCLDPLDTRYCTPILPQEFTPCGVSKWCVSGYCVEDSITSLYGEKDTAPPGLQLPTASVLSCGVIVLLLSH